MSPASETLDEMCELIIDCPHFTPEWTTSGYLVIRNQNIRDGRLDLSERSYTHLEDFERRIRRAKPRAGDIIFTREAPMGEVCLVPDGLECCVGQRQVLLRPAHNVDHRYLFYALRSPAVRHQILWNEGTGSTVSNVRIPILKAIKIPRLGEAEASIGEVLDNIDQKIELNRRMNETLEAMAQAIFRDWFVDFGPVRRKLEGTTDPIAIMGGLTLDPARAAELAGLFPDTLGDDDAPQDWVFTTLGEAFDVKIGRTPPRKEAEHFAPRGVGERWMSIRDMGACGAFIIATAEGLTKTAVETFRVPPIPDQTVVVSFKLTVGRVAITAGTMFSNEAIAQLRAKAGSPSPWFTYCWMKMFDYDQLGSTSSIATAVNSDSIKGMPFPKVPEGALSRFDEIVEPIFERIRASILESDTLAETRDYLLPRLMSGEVRVGELEAEVA
jgi:type I restriction enzyme S subunit